MNRRKNILTLIVILLLVFAGVFGTRYVQGQMKKGNATLFADVQTSDTQTSEKIPQEDSMNQKDSMSGEDTSEDKKSATSKTDTSEDKKSATSKKDTSEDKKSTTNKKNTSKDKQPSTKKQTLSCTLTIRCDSLLNHMDQLDVKKHKYVPRDGYILKKTKVTFTSGETVFDVLRRECKKRKIQIEYSWTPVYNSYYIEGIQQLYEFDCGYESGWVYQVEGGKPNYGASEYRLKGGESIVWAYTCEGQGADIESESR